MSITKVTLAKESNTGIEYLYPKTLAHSYRKYGFE